MNTTLIQLITIIQYRLGKCTHGADEKYYDFKLGNDSRSALEILSHLVDVSNYGLTMLGISKASHAENSVLDKVNGNLNAMKYHLSNNNVDKDTTKKLINGPLSDTLAHIGQLALLRRLEGNPIEWENYTNANI